MNICIYKHNPSVDVTLRILEAYERAFQKLGHPVLVLSQDMESYSAEQAREFARKFVEFKPGLGICYGFSAMPEISGGYFFRKHGIPLAILCFENPFFGLNEKLFDEISHEQDYYHFFVWDSYYLNLLRQSFKNCYPIRHAAEIPDLADGAWGESLPQFERGVAFVGNITDFTRIRSRRINNDDAINSLIDDVLAIKMNAPGLNIIDILTAVLKDKVNLKENDPRFSPTDDFFHKKIIFSLYEEGLGKYRHYLLSQLNMFNIDYYGEMSWTAPHITFHPPVSYFIELPRIYRSTVVNLDIPPLQSIHSVNNRFFDVSAAGSLLLTERRADLSYVFDDAEAITYTSLHQLAEKIRFYLENAGVRNQIVQKMKDCVQKNHTYFHRANYLLDTLPI